MGDHAKEVEPPANPLDGRHCRSCRKAPHLFAAGKGGTPTDRRTAFPSPPTEWLGLFGQSSATADGG